ncbi:hypothetical protein K502DRAFT_367324 [Neoconidiobolus thromboides FSU 785]|nr:hypothetical protein K502DRAFT_367324 [Neoconidiobolus thromboides FSU 785]
MNDPSSSKDNNNNNTNDSTLYGKTSNGKVFLVPKTKDMMSTLFSFKTKISLPSLITLLILGTNILLYFIIPSNYASTLFLILFLFWRLAYNGFLGYLLYRQSNQSYLTKLFLKLGWLDENNKVGKWIKTQLEIDMSNDYNYHTMPIEFNSWLLFRKLVDLILVNDFTVYLIFSLSHFNPRYDWKLWENCLRYLAAFFLIVFNLVVKLDAHRVVKDFAWYWGDFFFLIDQKLTFDGVFELAPHPMYSLGYAGYYGISLLMASPTVFYVSLLAHSLQFIFLVLVENPHIDKIYGGDEVEEDNVKIKEENNKDNKDNKNIKNIIIPKKNIYELQQSKQRMLFNNFDLFKSSDLFSLIIVFYGSLFLILILFQSINLNINQSIKYLSLIHSIIWRLFHSIGLGIIILGSQSSNKKWTRHFIKIGKTGMDAFNEWKSIYNLSSFMTYFSFILSAIAFYSYENGFFNNSFTLRHTFGLLLIILHAWTSTSVYETLKEFGWFYGDFFIDQYQNKLNYTGIYRYLNNPEKILGHSALYGIALISNSSMIFLLAILSHSCYLLFYYLVELPHMSKLYKGQLRKEAGVTKTVKGVAKSLKSNLKHHKNLSLALSSIEFTEGLIDKLEKGVQQSIVETKETLGGLMEKTKPHLKELILDTNSILNQSKLKLAETRERLLLDLNHNESSNIGEYKIELLNFIGKNEFIPAKYELGECIKLGLLVPYNGKHKYDWVGLYKVISNPSKTLTTISSKGRYLYTHLPPKNNFNNDLTVSESSGVEIDSDVENDINLNDIQRLPEEEKYYESILPVSKEELGDRKGNWRTVVLKFEQDRLFWEPGTYEFRLHSGFGHKVAAISRPFEIFVSQKNNKVNNLEEVLTILLPYLKRCLNIQNDEDMSEIDNLFANSEISLKDAEKISKIIKALFMIEFDPPVILYHPNLNSLGQRILEAIKVLVPFFNTTPTMKPIPITQMMSPTKMNLDQ